MRGRILFLTFLIGTAWITSASAQVVTPDQCKDALKPELFNKLQTQQDTFLWLSFLASSTQRTEKSSQSSHGLNIGYEGANVGLSQSDAQRLTNQIENKIDIREILHNQTSVSLMSGDANIKEWGECMRKGQTRLAMYFEPDPNNSKKATLHLQYFRAPSGSNPPVLTVSRFDVPGTIQSGDKECFRKGAKLSPGNECDLDILTANEWVSGYASIGFLDRENVRIPVRAYLAPRATLTFVMDTWPETKTATVPPFAKTSWPSSQNETLDSVHSYSLSDSVDMGLKACRLAPDGWVFLEGKRQPLKNNPPDSTYGGSEDVTLSSQANVPCWGRYKIDADGKRLCFGHFMKVGAFGDNSCTTTVRAVLGRMEWKSSEDSMPNASRPKQHK